MGKTESVKPQEERNREVVIIWTDEDHLEK